MAAPRSLRIQISRIVVGVGIGCLVLAAMLVTISRTLANPDVFARRTAVAIREPHVAAFVADRITTLLVTRRPDLIRVRPVVLRICEELVASRPFGKLVESAARKTHDAFFSEQGQRLVLSLPDVGLLLGDALNNAPPETAAKIPKQVGDVVLALNQTNPVLQLTLDLWRFSHRVRNLGRVLILLGVGLTVLGIALARSPYESLSSTGIGLIAGAVFLGLILPLGWLLAHSLPDDRLIRGAFVGVWRSYLVEMRGWALFLGGIGVLCTAAANSLMDKLNPRDLVTLAVRAVSSSPRSRLVRFTRGAIILAVGLLAVAFPGHLPGVLAVVIGLVLSYTGVREIFRLVLESVESGGVTTPGRTSGRNWLKPVIIFLLLAGGGGLWFVLKRPDGMPVKATASACNGHPELCGRRLNEVVFAGAHNAMSNASIPDWMFPHHQEGIPRQLEDGIRALLLDVHYGYPGGERIKTDLDDTRNTREKLDATLGPEAVTTALRIRDRLVGVDEGRKGLFLCHGLCELGATGFKETLDEIREFLVTHPDEVLLIVIEDYVTAADLARAFADSRLDEFVYRGAPGPPWPTLEEMVLSGGRVVVFLESGQPGVDWMLPAFKHIQETPYTFHKPEDFSCRPNRGGTGGSLFQINHWIETTPTPLPSNAEIVNSVDVLYARAQQCARERRMLPNIIAVDFYRSGDLFVVVDSLNGVRASGIPR